MTLAHISDPHFGTETPAVVVALAAAIDGLRPDLVICSGDLTQRARTRQFRQARAFLDALDAPWLAVPGNHDVPLWDVARRVLSPLGRYRRHIDDHPAPTRELPGLRVVGLDSTRRKVVGRLRPDRLPPIAGLREGDPADLRVLVTHHPLVRRPLEGAEAALRAAREAGVDLLLAGHHHYFHLTDGDVPGVEAGSCLSTRAHKNSFNVIRATPGEIHVTPWAWDGVAFAPGRQRSLTRRNNGVSQR